MSKYYSMPFIFIVVLFFGQPLLAAWRNPTQPPMQWSGEQVIHNKYGLLLSSIIHSKNRQAATINGKVYAVGDTVGKYKILSIEMDHIIVKGPKSGKKIELTIAHNFDIVPVKVAAIKGSE